MVAYAVKHIEAERGPLSTTLKHLKKQPYSYTDKENEAQRAAAGNFIYVVEVRRHKNDTRYWLGYKYRASECLTLAGGATWDGGFKFKNTTAYGEPSGGYYFDTPVLIKDAEFTQWYKSKVFGMIEIPSKYVAILDRLFADPKNCAKSFTV